MTLTEDLELNTDDHEIYFDQIFQEQGIEKDDFNVPKGCVKFCKNCGICVYHHVFLKYNLFSKTYPNLFIIYKFFLTISVSQVACEKSFFKLKLIISKTRSSLTESKLEAFILMYSEKDILNSIDIGVVLDQLAAKRSYIALLHYKSTTLYLCC